MAKPFSVKRILKIIGIGIVFLTLPTALFFGAVYLKYNEDLPTGQQGIAADNLAHKMLNALNYNAYKNTNTIQWSFNNKHHYKWQKANKICEVSWQRIKVVLKLQNTSKSSVYVADTLYEGIEKNDYINKALKYFNNDSFWLVAPYKVFDAGVERRIVTTAQNTKALLVTYTKGGTTPGDSYLWHLDASGMPQRFQMWVDILPIGGLEASWNQWQTTATGAKLPLSHKLMVLNINLQPISTA